MDEAARGPTSSADEFRAWVAVRREALRTTAFLICGDWHQADDLVQEALTRIFSRWEQVSRAGSPNAYARTVIVRLQIDRTRTAWWRRESPVAAVPDTYAKADIHTDDTDREALLQALAVLPPKQRAVIVLRYWEDMTYAQIADVLGGTHTTAKSHASRGLVALRQELTRHGQLHQGGHTSGLDV